MIRDHFGPVTMVRRATMQDVKGFSRCAEDAVARGLLWWTVCDKGVEVMVNLGELAADGGWPEIRAACLAADPEWGNRKACV